MSQLSDADVSDHLQANHAVSTPPDWNSYLRAGGRDHLTALAASLVDDPVDLIQVEIDLGRALLLEIAGHAEPQEDRLRCLVIDIAYDVVTAAQPS